MRKLTTALAVLSAATLAGTLAGSAVAGPSAPKLRVHKHASAIYAYDGSEDGSGPVFPATSVEFTVKNCPAGDYWLDAVLVQDGRADFDWATSALGAGEFTCHGGTETGGMSFYGERLHPGRAYAEFALRPQSGGDEVVVDGGRKVWIPAT